MKLARLLVLIDPSQPQQPALQRAQWLAARTGAVVLVGYAERSAGGDYVVRFEPAPAEIASDDVVAATAAMNAAVESVARRDFRQYQWTYKRYTIRPPGSGESSPYERRRRRPR